ncbi:sulfatase [Mycolicibacterium rhodesiae JS60]|nr:sulfatase [Mycolicibacterium rhodesiae JS60]
MRGRVKLGLLAAWFVTSFSYYLGRVEMLGLRPALLVYLGLLVLTTTALLLVGWIRTGWVRWPLALLLAVSAGFFDTYTGITGSFLTYDAFISMLDSAGFLTEALEQYRDQILLAVGKSLLLLLGIGLRPGPVPRLPRLLPVLAPPLVFLLLVGVMFIRSGDGSRGLAPVYPPLGYLSLYGYEMMQGSATPRQPVTLAHTHAPMARDIVLIIDEAVSGNYLDLNTPAGVATNLTQTYPGVDIVNYGYAASITNCSAGTNVTLRYGGTRDDYPRINVSMPSIWQYAKKAGLSTVYIDGQTTSGKLQNLMTDAEKADIDQFIQFDGVPVVQRDMAALDKLVTLLGDDKLQMIVVNKVGAHFPVANKYPDDFLKYQPALPRDHSDDVAEKGTKEGFDGSPEAWVRYRNSYRNTLQWGVGEFFRRLLTQADLSHAVVIYTSDHGQNLHERRNPGVNTHCDTEPVPEEGLVPLVVIQGKGVKALDWQTNLARNRNASSHYNIFPTLLVLMGYEPAAVAAEYGRSLDVPTDDPFTFNVKFNVRLRAKPDFRHIDLSQIVTPPASDEGVR